MDKYFDKAFLLIAVMLGFMMGMTTTWFQHREQMTAYELIKNQSINQVIENQVSKAKRGAR